MTTLFHAGLSGRDYASHLLHVGDLLEWTKSKRLHLKTTPPVNEFEFVQVEALLSAIERNANNLTPDQALEIVLNTPALKDDPIFQKYPDDIDPTTCRWLIGANAHKKWRELLTDAITAHEVTLLDFGSKLPIHTAPATDTATTAPVGADGDGPTNPAAPVWSLKRPKRFQGYGKPLYDLLKAAHAAGQPKPSARDVLDRWKENPPPDVSEVTDNGLKYYDARGNTRPTDLEAIRKAIGRRTN